MLKREIKVSAQIKKNVGLTEPSLDQAAIFIDSLDFLPNR
jgi:hypothetical protein